MTTPNFGSLIENPSIERDAIHIATLPAIATEKLAPGTHVGIVDRFGLVSIGVVDKLVGIVDPFLKKPVKEGEVCWLFMYPNTITSLKHNWTHPDIPTAEEAESQEKTFKYLTQYPASMNWMEAYASEVNLSVDHVLKIAKKALDDSSFHHTIGFDTPDIVYNSNQEFWKHYEILTGESVEHGEDRTFFSCAC